MGNFVKADRSAVMLKAGTADEAVIKGINKLGLPDFTRQTIKASEFRTEVDIEFTTSAEYGRVTFGGNLVLGDTTGQDILNGYWKNNTKITDCRFYLNDEDFVTCDLANDPEAGFQVSKIGGRQADKAGLYALDCEMVCAGQIATFNTHMVDVAVPTLAFVAALTPGTSSATITDSGSGFVTAGFKAGQTLIVEGSTSNDGQYTILTVVAGTITLKVGDALATEASVEDCTLHGGSL